MYLNFKRWVKGNDEIHAIKLQYIDEKFKKFVSELNDEFSSVDKESIFIHGMLNLLNYIHMNERRYLDRLRILLETYKIFLSNSPHYKDSHLKPLVISTLLDRSEIHLHGFFDPHLDGSSDCYNLIECLSNYIENMVHSDRENLLLFTLTDTKH